MLTTRLTVALMFVCVYSKSSCMKTVCQQCLRMTVFHYKAFEVAEVPRMTLTENFP